MSGDGKVILKPGRLIAGSIMWKGRTINLNAPPLDYKLYHHHKCILGKGWFPDDDLGGPPRIIPWQLWLDLDIIDDPSTGDFRVRLPGGRFIYGFHLCYLTDAAGAKAAPPAAVRRSEKPADLVRWMIEFAGGKKLKMTLFVDAARKRVEDGGAGASRDEARLAYRKLPMDLRLSRGGPRKQ